MPLSKAIRWPGSSDVYHHEMPGGQYTNLLEQARSLGSTIAGIDVSQAYADVNRMFGDIVKVTPLRRWSATWR